MCSRYSEARLSYLVCVLCIITLVRRHMYTWSGSCCGWDSAVPFFYLTGVLTTSAMLASILLYICGIDAVYRRVALSRCCVPLLRTDNSCSISLCFGCSSLRVLWFSISSIYCVSICVALPLSGAQRESVCVCDSLSIFWSPNIFRSSAVCLTLCVLCSLIESAPTYLMSASVCS